jgi:hypothetical protein
MSVSDAWLHSGTGFTFTRRSTPPRFCPGRLRLTLNRSSDLGPSSALQPFRRDA